MPLLFCGCSFSSSVEMGRGGNGPESARLSDVSSCCQSPLCARHLEKSPVKLNTGIIMLIIWNKAQSPLPPVTSSSAEKTLVGLMGLSIISLLMVLFFQCFLSQSSYLKRSISKQELGLIWGPQIDCILQPGCGDL